MYFAYDEHGVRTHIDDADAKGVYTCPACKCRVTQKRGALVAHHFAHKSKGFCDRWYSGKTSRWHNEMQSLFPEHNREVVVWNTEHTEYHIADAVCSIGTKPFVFEFQHSVIPREDFIARTNSYTELGYGTVWIFDFCYSKSQKTIFYTNIPDSGWVNIIWPGKDRVRFLDHMEFGDDIYIYFHIRTGKGRKVLIESNGYYPWERWEYIDPFNPEQLFIQLDLMSFDTLKEFEARCYSEEDFKNRLKKLAAGKAQY